MNGNFISALLDIHNEMISTPGLSEFRDVLIKENKNFHKRVFDGVKSKGLMALEDFVNEAIKGVGEAEKNKIHQGNFRETNLDWAHVKIVDLRSLANDLLPLVDNQEEKKFLIKIIKKLSN